MTRRRTSSSSLTLVLLFTVSSLPALAIDGVIEINQAKAEAGGVTSSDAPGFPVTLDAAGSYRLTGDLTSTSTTEHVIHATAESVVLDLNGFSVVGPNDCAPGGGTLDCSVSPNPTVADGIRIDARGAVVRNGVVRGAAGYGIVTELNATLQNLVVRDSAYTGISTHGIVENCQAYENGNKGIGVNGTVFQSVSRYNGGAGFSLLQGAAIGIKAEFNYGPGVQTNAVSLEDCGAFSNGNGSAVEPGIEAGYGTVIRGCVAAANSGVGI